MLFLVVAVVVAVGGFAIEEEVGTGILPVFSTDVLLWPCLHGFIE
jgi:hypothetical protein